MSLRVLLADESPSIKKAFSLALKDYGVQIQTVHQGIDVAELYDKFKPDICFMDILLPKLNGYDACATLKNTNSSKLTPVVLMWSGFMELDETKFTNCLADSSIEKPFETQTLRSIVKELVPKIKKNEISDHLIFDAPQDISTNVEAEPFPQSLSNFDKDEVTAVEEVPSLEDLGAELSELPSIESLKFDHLRVPENNSEDELRSFPDLPDLDSILGENNDISDFSMPEGLNLNSIEKESLNTDSIEEISDWKSKELEDFEAKEKDLAPEGLDDIEAFSMEKLDNDDLPFDTNDALGKDLSSKYSMPEGLDLPPTPDKLSVLKEAAKEAAFETMKDEVSSNVEIAKPYQSPKHIVEEKTQQTPKTPAIEPLKKESFDAVEPLKEDSESEVLKTGSVPQMSKEELKRLILAQSKDIIESVVWDVVPELAKEMIQKEIQRLTGEIKHDGELR